MSLVIEIAAAVFGIVIIAVCLSEISSLLRRVSFLETEVSRLSAALHRLDKPRRMRNEWNGLSEYLHPEVDRP
jgi:hypothetical protein